MTATTLADRFITVASAAAKAQRSKTVVRRWITEGWIPEHFILVVPGRNGAWLIDGQAYENLLPGLLAEMGNRRGGRGHVALDAHGNPRA